MARSRTASAIKSTLVGMLLTISVMFPAQAADDGWSFSANAALTTDYVFRGVSQTRNGPAVQGGFDVGYGIFYAGIWASNLDFGAVGGRAIADLEIDYYAGIAPTWKGITFDFGAFYLTYPGAFDPGTEFDYLELASGASYTFGDQLTLGVINYYTSEYLGETGVGSALEFSAEYAFSREIFNFFSPTVSALLAHQWIEDLPDYAYWNVGLNLGFMENWSADIRYWDTDFSTAGCVAFNVFTDTCDARVVGTVKATF